MRKHVARWRFSRHVLEVRPSEKYRLVMLLSVSIKWKACLFFQLKVVYIDVNEWSFKWIFCHNECCIYTFTPHTWQYAASSWSSLMNGIGIFLTASLPLICENTFTVKKNNFIFSANFTYSAQVPGNNKVLIKSIYLYILSNSPFGYYRQVRSQCR